MLRSAIAIAVAFFKMYVDSCKCVCESAAAFSSFRPDDVRLNHQCCVCEVIA